MIRRILIWLPVPVILLGLVYTLIVDQVEVWVIVVAVASMLLSSFVAQSGKN